MRRKWMVWLVEKLIPWDREYRWKVDESSSLGESVMTLNDQQFVKWILFEDKRLHDAVWTIKTIKR